MYCIFWRLESCVNPQTSTLLQIAFWGTQNIASLSSEIHSGGSSQSPFLNNQLWLINTEYEELCSFLLVTLCFNVRYVHLWEAKWQHGDCPQRLCHGNGNGRRGNGGDPVSQGELCRVHEPPQLLPQKLRYRTQVSLNKTVSKKESSFWSPSRTGTTSLSSVCHNRAARKKENTPSFRPEVVCSRGHGYIHSLLVALVCSNQHFPFWGHTTHLFTWCNLLKC